MSSAFHNSQDVSLSPSRTNCIRSTRLYGWFDNMMPKAVYDDEGSSITEKTRELLYPEVGSGT